MPDTSPDLPATSPLAAYRQAVEQRGFAPDEAQRRAAEALERCFQALHEAHRHGAIQGVYLWGPVGRGKTWLMDHFYQCLRVPARRQHFHHFMQWVHQRQFELTGTADPLRALARELARDVRVLCFDELFVSDIGDAILLGSLLRQIPVARLAGVLVYTGVKLVDFKALGNLSRYGRMPRLVYAATALAIVFTDLLTGVLVGFALTLLKLVLKAARLKIALRYTGEHEAELRLSGAATFLKVPALSRVLDEVKPGTTLHVPMDNLSYVDHACMELLEDWGRMA
ncbi:cell division protein ZapE, partial [Acinetobacter baumannii]